MAESIYQEGAPCWRGALLFFYCCGDRLAFGSREVKYFLEMSVLTR